jgi:hypothetical protein
MQITGTCPTQTERHFILSREMEILSEIARLEEVIELGDSANRNQAIIMLMYQKKNLEETLPKLKLEFNRRIDYIEHLIMLLPEKISIDSEDL